MVAALYVETNGVYAGIEDVDIWDQHRDARLYDGPHPVVAHPPCARWSTLAALVEARGGPRRGDDNGCFAAALEAVRTYGGVLEHPANTAAWAAYHLPRPRWQGGWTLDLFGGASCHVEQGRYGLPVRKATWLYAHGVDLPDLRWTHTTTSTDIHEWRARHGGRHEQWTQSRHRGGHHGLTATTPPLFRDQLLAIARTAHAQHSMGGGAGALASPHPRGGRPPHHHET